MSDFEDNLMLDRVRASLQARLEGRDDGGDTEVMRLVDKIVEQAVAELEDPLPTLPPTPVDEWLTPRQVEVIQLIAAGRSNGEISDILGIKRKTVEWHKNALKVELDLCTTADIVRYAIAKKLTHEYKE